MPIMSTIATHWKRVINTLQFTSVVIRRAVSVPFARQLMYGEAVARLIGAWILVRLVPYRLWREILGQPGDSGSYSISNDGSAEIALHIASLHFVLHRIFGTRFTCLMLALSARGMLKARGVASRLVLGVNRKPTDVAASKLGAHAWVTSGDVEIIGHEGNETFIPVAVYSGY